MKIPPYKKKYFPSYQAKSTAENLIVSLVLFMLICMLPGCSVKNLLLFPVKFIVFIIKLAGIPFIIYLLIRMTMVKWSSFFMKKKSTHVPDEIADEKKELANSPAEINFREFSETEDITISKHQGIGLVQAINTGLQTWIIFKKSVGFLLLGTVFIFFLSKILFGEFKYGSPILVLLTTLIMYLFVKIRFKATRRVSLKLCIISYSILFLFYYYFFGVFAYAPEVLSGIVWLFLVLIIFALAYIVYEFLKIKRQISLSDNQQLLILRVFGSDHNTAFLFREISRTWRFIGSFVTIADPSYIRYQYSLSSRENRRMFFNLFLLYFFLLLVSYGIIEEYIIGYCPTWLIIFWEKLSALQVIFIIGVLAMLLGLPVFLISISRITSKRFIPSLTLLNKKTDNIKSNKRSISGTYKNFTLYCFDNIWKKAVQQILPVSKAVLMDLRGFTPGRKGCRYEIGLLIDKYPINKIVFLADEGPGIEAIKEMVKEQWKNMSALSPNSNIKNPELKIYFVREEDKADINRIIALLTMSLEYQENIPQTKQNIIVENSLKNYLRKAIGNLGAGLTLNDDSMIINKQYYHIKKPKNSVSFFEKWDLKLAKPSAGKIFIPLLGFFLITSFVIQVIPFARSFSKYNNPIKITAAPAKRPGIYVANTAEDSLFIDIKIGDTSKQNVSWGNNKYKTILFWTLKITGGKPSRAFKYDSLKIISETEDGKFLTNLDPREFDLRSDRTQTEYVSSRLISSVTTNANEKNNGRIIFTTQTLFPSTIQPIKRIKGSMDLFFILPEQKFIVRRPDSLLSKAGLLEIILNDSMTSKRFWLERTNDDEIILFTLSDMDECEIHFYTEDGELIFKEVNNNTWTTSYSKLENSWIEIIPKKTVRKESFSFEKEFSAAKNR